MWEEQSCRPGSVMREQHVSGPSRPVWDRSLPGPLERVCSSRPPWRHWECEREAEHLAVILFPGSSDSLGEGCVSVTWERGAREGQGCGKSSQAWPATARSLALPTARLAVTWPGQGVFLGQLSRVRALSFPTFSLLERLSPELTAWHMVGGTRGSSLRSVALCSRAGI